MAERHPLLADAEALREQALARLETLVTLESPSGDRGLLARLADELQCGYERVGARVERDAGPDGDHLVCQWGADADGGHVLLIGHYDTVLPAGTIGDRPFACVDDVLSGPGVFDMKGALVQVELAMQLLDGGRGLPRPVRLVIVNDEEIGSPDGQRVVAAHAEGAVAAIGLEAPLPGGRLKTGRRGVARVRLRVEGREAHAGLDQTAGVSAIDELVDQVRLLQDRLPAPPGVACNVGLIGGGTRANVVAGQASAELGLRFGDPEAERSAADVLESLQVVRDGASLRVQWLSRRPVWPADPHNPLAAEFAALGVELGMELGTGTSGGAGDTNYTGAAGIPTVDGLGPEGKGAHGPAERASLRSLLERAALLAHYLGGGGAQPVRR
jgi:glutamate carboxypeptidase